jgi:hypothetical protein
MACDRICACCKCVFYVFQMFQKDVASVSCGCCKSRSGCSALRHEGGMEDVAEPWGLRFRCCMKRFEMFHLVLSDVA